MLAVVSGAILGYAMGLFAGFWVMLLLVVLSRRDRLPVGDQAQALAGVAAMGIGFTPIAWIIAGTAAGTAYALADAGSGPDLLGSPSILFTAGVLVVAWLPLPPLIAFFPRYWWFYVPLCLAFTVLFGWGLPVLAETG